MRVALISDLHGNLTALETVLADLARERPDRVLCLGDVAATGPQPRETVERLRELGCPVVMGNADAVLLAPIPDVDDEEMRRVLEIDRWCSEQLSSDQLDFIRNFRPILNTSLDPQNELLCFHGSPGSFDDVIVATTPEDELDRMLAGHGATVMAGGHTHEQFLRWHGGTTLINPGSVGLDPPSAGYALVSSEDGRLGVEFRRLPLDIEEVRQAALGSAMPHAEWWAAFWEEG
ncbi:MAG: metallophosphoesterase family protein [Rubrobacter sp.]